ncbi:MAG: S41 family peptidase [Planctomycetaceae bacterium]|nr:S41 family peptidase [Planctomycetaceae bacterium]
MSRRNLFLLVLVAVVAVFCQQRVQKHPYGRMAAEAMAIIENRYLEPVRAQSLFEGALDGMMSRLDENSAYVTAAELPEFQRIVDQQYGGVGIVLTLDPRSRQLTVLSPLAGSPAYRAGIRAGDKILRINKQSTQGVSLQDAVTWLSGKPGDTVTLMVLHRYEDKPVEIRVVRETIQVPTVSGDAHHADGSWNFLLPGPDRIGYIRISSFTETTSDELEKALAWLAKQHARGLVLDLRDNPGGYIAAAIDACRMFVASGVIVTTRRRDGRVSEIYEADGRRPTLDVPMAVLVNQQTASAGEIVAACLQDHHRAAIFGQRSFGKGTIQEMIPLADGAGILKLTTASYWRPSGKNIHRESTAKNGDWGVLPDKGCETPIGDDEQNRWRQWRAERDVFSENAAQETAANPKFVDRPLAAAVKYLEQKIVAKPEITGEKRKALGRPTK